MRADEAQEVVEQEARVLRSGRGLGVELHAEERACRGERMPSFVPSLMLTNHGSQSAGSASSRTA